ncbi:uncharacterized protein BX664DRAFT_330980 [Halteromyces radiatus]|uniref:uncharacterized protein n=1 Tax=Halteromyces radiatus TaxID=101107 RepID=UPI00221ED702|nr:uncharacterized protein BX664DRAFT_330980 [Halteromyces radiatus]KAI8088635.1 hypothetical protein BX664DRAFT_330980 [Halteromyces radiatus]
MTRYQQLSTKDDINEINHLDTQPNTFQTELETTFNESLGDDQHGPVTTESRLLLPLSSAPSSSNSTRFTRPFFPRRPRLFSTNDGVFANMSAKPELEKEREEETPPSYNDAALDVTPPYWQTTVIAPMGMGDMILVEGLPVGSIFVFFWNLLVSASFQFIGFILTHLLHTSHAGKNGSRAGLGVSLVQFGFYVRSHGSLDGLSDEDDPDDDDGDIIDGNMGADIVAYFIMVLGWFIILRSVSDYLKAKHMEKIIMTDPSTTATLVIDRTV